ncbi:esterase-like activity of phytase family protein [Amycolatopsis nigrescens]|uniref:esterase-like activity of phytase family protein n=1 Tax=Amycolatopsis nigrescens TaxID=381445 RepID=UPI00036FBF2B|nr:esterase-like activity of phytase family protein [Amycolatopsis nigrescens]
MRAWLKRGATLAAVVLAVLGVVQVPAQAAPPRGVEITRFLGVQTLPHQLTFDGTVVGGLSGVDRDPATGTWYLVSDDRWRYNPARFYTGALDFDPLTGAFTGVKLTGVTTFRRADGTPYPGFGLPETVDPETIRFDPLTRRVLWGQEGDRSDETHPGLPLSDQSLRWAGRDGGYLGEIPLPDNLHLTETASGPRRNYGFEALAVTRRTIAAVVEAPRYEDGALPTTETGAPARITVWNRAERARAQYVYPIDPAPAAPIPPGGIIDSGVSELLAIDSHRYLALERSWIEGVNYKVKLYEIDLSGASNVLSRDSLGDGGYRPVTKRLVLDLSQRATVQNYESLSWGPRLRTGECTVVIGSDDNFHPAETTEFLAYAVRGC